MPGLSFVFDASETASQSQPQQLSILSDTIVLPNYQSELLKQNRNWSLYTTAYPGYPIHQYDTDSVEIIIEGKIYNKSPEQITHEIQTFVDKYINKQAGQEFLAQWLQQTDGQYLIFAMHKQSGMIFIFNDVFSHLPCYYTISDKRMCLSRSLRFVRQISERSEFDPLAMSLYVMFSYYPFNKTFLKGIKRLEPASLICISTDRATIHKEKVHTFNFDHKEHAGLSLKKSAKKLAEVYAQTAKQHCCQAEKNIVMLTGGMDSRAVAAAISASQTPYTSISWIDHQENAKNDVTVAGQVAQILGVEWDTFRLPPMKGCEVYQLLRMKDGIEQLERSFINPFLKHLIDTYGRNAQIITGNTGWSLRYALPDTKLSSLPELASYILKKHAYFSINLISRLFGISEQTIMDEILHHLEQYPETKIEQKNAHYIIHERAINYLLQGADRHRHYLWHDYPDFSLPFFRCAINCRDEYKKNYVLYARVLRELSEPLATLPRISGSNYKDICQPLSKSIKQGCYLTNPVRLFKKYVLKVRPVAVPKPKRHPHAMIKIMNEQLGHTPVMTEIISRKTLKEITDHASDLNPQAMSTLFTLLSAIEYHASENCTLEKYPEEIMDARIE